MERDTELERFAGLQPEVVQAKRIAVWEEKLDTLAAAAGISLIELPAIKPHPHKVLLAVALKQTTSINNGWLARRLSMGAPASASQFICRLRLTKNGPNEIANLLSRVKTCSDCFARSCAKTSAPWNRSRSRSMSPGLLRGEKWIIEPRSWVETRCCSD